MQKELKKLKINNRELLQNISILAQNYAKEYQYYYFVPKLREQFNEEYAYFYKDIYSDNIIKIKPANIDKKTEILKEKVGENALKKCLYIGFKVPYYQ